MYVCMYIWFGFHRQYAAKMRTVDVVKCWPFGEDSEEDIKALLPPITVAKFRWWSHELQAFNSNQTHQDIHTIQGEGLEFSRNESEFEKSEAVAEKFEMVCPVCRVFTAATVNAVNSHVDSCLAQSSHKKLAAVKTKTTKPPKKRSIAEIFAVAPQIEAIDVDDDENVDEESSGGEDKFGSCKFSSGANVFSTIKGKKNINMKMRKKKKKMMMMKKKKNKKKRRVLEEKGMAIVSKLKKKKKKKKKNKLKKKAVKDGSIAKKVCDLYHKILLICNHHYDFCVVVI
jgi:hypothetical protein